MKSSAILDEISGITTELASNYPEIFRILEEENFPISHGNSQSVSEKDLSYYLESLKKILGQYRKNHQDKLIIYPAN